MSDHHTGRAARAELSRALAMSEELLDAHASHPGYKTSAEWLAALIARSQVVNNAARGYLGAAGQTQAPA